MSDQKWCHYYGPGIRGYTLVRRTHTRYDTGDWSTRWERMGDPVWPEASDG